MAPANTPGRKKRENNYFDVGVQGRRTGITLKDTGIRDEHGLEPLSGIFSSAVKSPGKRSIRRSNTTLTSSEEMQVGDSSALEPTVVLSERRLTRNAKTIFPPPMGRSPMKTSLGSSPRRPSSAAPPSPVRLTNSAKSRSSSHPTAHRRLDFSMDDAPSSVGRNQHDKARTNGVNGKARANLFDLQPSPERAMRATRGSSALAEEQAEADETMPDTTVNGVGHSSPIPQMDDDSMPIIQNDDAPDISHAAEQTEVEEDTSVMPPPPKRRPGRQRRSNASATSTQDEAPPVPQAEEPAIPKRRGRAPKHIPVAPVEVEEERAPESVLEEGTIQEESVVAAPAEKRRGRPAKRSLTAEMPPPNAEPRPPKRARKAAEKEPPLAKKAKQPPPSERNPNSKISSVKRSKTSAAASVAGSTSAADRQNAPARSRSLQVLRSTTPMQDEGVHTTRAGRASFKPLAFWKGERTETVYQDGEPVLQEIVRAQDVTPVKRTRRRGTATRKRKLTVYEDEEEEDEEEWATDGGGILTGIVRRWDAELGAGVMDDEGMEEEIAFAASSIQTYDVPGSNFRYAKTTTLPFFGSGMVDLPPQGYKRSKNARKMQMVFFVHQGRVTVEVADEVFSIGKGGVFQVPRGNFYSISNEGSKLARIFFAQGCEVEAQHGKEAGE